MQLCKSMEISLNWRKLVVYAQYACPVLLNLVKYYFLTLVKIKKANLSIGGAYPIKQKQADPK